MTDESLGSISLFFQQLQQGDRDAAWPMWQRFFPRLSGLANRILSGRRLPQSAEDAVQNAFFQFFQHVERGSYPEGMRREELWSLLSTLTAQAAKKLTTRERALKRGGGHVRLESEFAGVNQGGLDEILGEIATADWDLICEELLEKLDEDLREVALLRLAGYTNPQIKTLLNCSLRSIERRLQLIRMIWKDDHHVDP
jgi:DNA-directed RNA polymerase specialized sigma24 family protein